MKGWGSVAWLGVIGLLIGCDAGPSAVLPDGEGQAPVVQTEKAPVWAQPKAEPAQLEQDSLEQASMAVPETTPAPAETPSAAKVVITQTRYGDWPLWSRNRQYSEYENATYHYEKHGETFGATSYEDWVAKVHAFIHSPPKGTQTVRRTNGDTLFYDPKGNVFAVMTKQGAPRTMFKPESGAAYWTEQKRIEAEKKLGRDPRPEKE